MRRHWWLGLLISFTAQPSLAVAPRAPSGSVGEDEAGWPAVVLEELDGVSWRAAGAGRAVFLGRAVPVAGAPGDAALSLVRRASGALGASLGLRVRAVEPVGLDRVVHLEQVLDGRPVLDAGATLLVGRRGIRYADLRLAALAGEPGGATLAADEARARAHTAVLAHAGRVVRGGAPVLAVYGAGDRPRLVWAVAVTARQPAGAWRVLVDARDGAIVEARRTSLDAIEGSVSFAVEPTCPGEGVAIERMPHVEWAPQRFADDAGDFTAATALAAAAVRLHSPFVALIDLVGPLAGPWSIPLAPSPAVNSLVVDDAPLDQVDPFFHVHRVRGWLRAHLEGNNGPARWSDAPLPVYLNIPEHCNAYYDGTLNFFAAGYSPEAGVSCNNTGQVAGIVYHEYGHGIHDHSRALTFDNDTVMVSEGIADYVAAAVSGDPRMRGLLAGNCQAAFRSCDNTVSYCTAGCTVGPLSEPHDGGQALSGALWDLRQGLVGRYGAAGADVADRLVLRFVALVASMATAYDAMLAADEDDDGDPLNGTRHSCEINRAFANDQPGGKPPHFPAHVGRVPSTPSLAFEHRSSGFVDAEPGSAPRLELGLRLENACAVGELTDLRVHYRADGGAEREVALVREATLANGEERWAVTLTDVAAPATITYYFTALFDGDELVHPPQLGRPRDSAWPHHRFSARFARQHTLFASDFEADDGGLTSASQTPSVSADWEWGEPTGRGGDPGAARSGRRVWGTDLGGSGDGLYAAGATTHLALPVLDASAYSEVRLQFWRRLHNADVAAIEIDGERVFENRVGAVFWHDPDWVFQDLDISRWAAGKPALSIRFVMTDAFNAVTTPGGATPELGGWNLDDLTVAGTRAVNPGDPEGTDGPGAVPDPLAAWTGGSCAAAGAGPTAAWVVALLLVRRRRWSLG